VIFAYLLAFGVYVLITIVFATAFLFFMATGLERFGK